MSETVLDLAAQLGVALKDQGLLLATAESCTGGGIAATVTEIAGSSAWFERGFVTYSNAAKEELLGVAPETLAAQGAVSEAVVREMATGALVCSAAQLAVAVSGIAGPDGGTPDKPVGTVWLAWALKDGECRARRFQFSGGRAEVREAAVRTALEGCLYLLHRK